MGGRGEQEAHVRETREIYRVKVGKSEGKRLLGKPRYRWEDNIKFILIKYNGRMWNGLMRLRLGTSGWLLCVRAPCTSSER